MRIRATAAILTCFLVAGLGLGAGNAGAYRERLKHPELGNREEWLVLKEIDGSTKPIETLEGACGATVSSGGELYVSDYYHRGVGVYSALGFGAGGGVSLAGGRPAQEINTLNAVCGLAIDSAGNLYATEFHQAVVRLSPGEPMIDPGEATGVAVDDSGNLYVDDRTYVAVYDAPVVPGEGPVEKIGSGSLGDGYGVAVDPKGETVYVADASDNTVKGYVPEASLSTPQLLSNYAFRSLVDAALAVDPTNGHVLVVDDLKPGFEDPEVAVLEFSNTLGNPPDRLAPRKVGEPSRQLQGPIFGEPSGIAVDPKTGDLYVTTGNGLESNVVKYGPYEPFAPPASASPSSGPPSPATASSAATHAAAPAAAGPTAPRRGGGSESVVIRRGPVQVSFGGKLTPHRLPRHGKAPVGIAVDTRITGTGGDSPPQLRRIAIAINRNGELSATGLPVCSEREIQPSTTAGARAACGSALVGEGHFAANVKLPEQSPFPSSGKVLAFNGRLHGKPAILAHIYGTQPAPTSYVLPFSIKASHGTYGTVLEASLPQATGDWGFVTGLKMTLRRSFRYHGKRHSYLSAGCPAPAGFPGAVFPLARTHFDFAGNLAVTSVINRSCTAKG